MCWPSDNDNFNNIISYIFDKNTFPDIEKCRSIPWALQSASQTALRGTNLRPAAAAALFTGKPGGGIALEALSKRSFQFLKSLKSPLPQHETQTRNMYLFPISCSRFLFVLHVGRAETGGVQETGFGARRDSGGRTLLLPSHSVWWQRLIEERA